FGSWELVIARLRASGDPWTRSGEASPERALKHLARRRGTRHDSEGVSQPDLEIPWVVPVGRDESERRIPRVLIRREEDGVVQRVDELEPQLELRVARQREVLVEA